MDYSAGLRQIVTYGKQLEASQWWPPAVLRQWQLRRLGRLASRAREHVPYYADLLKDLHAAPGAPLDWRKVPLLTKAIVRSEGERLRSRSASADRELNERSTTGSTAQPLKVVKELRPRLVLWAVKLRGFRWFDTDFSGNRITLTAPGTDETAGTVHRHADWGAPLTGLQRTGRQCIADVYLPAGQQLDLIEAEQSNYVVTYPTNLRLLLREARASARRLPFLRYVQTQGAQLDPDLRGECREVLGVPLYDVYGATEADWIAVQCPQHEHYHVQAEVNFVEVLTEAGRACKPGETGRIVVTPLNVHAMPLLRYDLGDYAEVGEPCACGRGLPVLKRIFGRQRDLLTLPSGVKRMAPFGTRVFATLPVVRQFQIAQTSLTEVEARVVAERALTEAERSTILRRLENQLGPGFTLTLRQLDELPRAPGGKFAEFVSEL